MKQKLKTIIVIAILLVISIWIIDKIPFNKNINQQITANIYENGVAVGQTTLVMNGEKSNYLFRKKERFIGEFLIPYAEKTDRSDLQTSITWNGEDNTQYIIYFYKGVFKLAEDMELVPYLLINDSMTKFAIMLTNHTVIATSDELYKLYIKHITWHSDTTSTSIVEVNKIPKID
ncbi:hypothetical protein [Clostridium formicaceticum]|uniref:Uncharacterized protein n=1 Tax=Clostridium formicaceticum TaxID=1497 RepID=A0AAC9WGZ8_9CLOT|nr:hypothetical protein [Clostridium formicaceticum]AOY77725.1 hypothetical protein BJL90_18805 [Clostridium formicaceticum]ARE88319.1 hypothetical protein CLFO_27200 [Clostridium formicaceticum]